MKGDSIRRVYGYWVGFKVDQCTSLPLITGISSSRFGSTTIRRVIHFESWREIQ